MAITSIQQASERKAPSELSRHGRKPALPLHREQNPQSLRQELMLLGEKDIHVATVMPATIDTPFFQHAANYTGRAIQAMPPVYPAERVARASCT